MKYTELTEYLVKNLVLDKDMVTVKEFPSEENDNIIIEVLVSESDLPRLIGKNGRNANAIRTLVQASSNLDEQKYVKINIESF